MTSHKKISEFRRAVWAYYKKNGRNDLPWRKTADPYKILVSEMMLQQTQVPRVIEKYTLFLRKFPTVKVLARSDLSHVLKEWNGLGYNRRAKYLHDAARVVMSEYNGKFPREYPRLRAVSGIGQYTANAVRVFAFDEPEVLVETNVRTAIIHHFLGNRTNIEDGEIEKIAAAAAIGQDPREWHSALFDYGAHLKTMGVRTNAQSARHVRQSKFEGSLRQLRGHLLREFYKGPPFASSAACKGRSFAETKRIEEALEGLERDGLIKKEKGKWRIA